MTDTPDSGRRVAWRAVEYLVPLIIAGLVSYFTTVATLQVTLARLEEREKLHYDMLTNRLDEMRLDIRWLVSQGRGGINVAPPVHP